MTGVGFASTKLYAFIALIVIASAVGVAGTTAGAQDGQIPGKILMVRDGAAWMWQGGDLHELYGDGNLSDPRWSPDGEQILYVATQDTYSDLVLFDIDTGATEQLTNNAPPFDLEPGSQLYVNRSSWALDPSWSESGRIAFIADYEESGRMALWLMESPGAGAVLAPELAPTGVDIEGVSLSASGALAAYCVKSFDGVNYYTTVVLRDLSDGAEYPIVDEAGGVYDPSISPDEQLIAVTIRSPEGVSDIWVVGRADSTATQITFGEQAVAAAWSPDGEWLAYLRPSGDGFGLWAIPMNDGAASGPPISLGEWEGIDATSGLSWSYAEG